MTAKSKVLKVYPDAVCDTSTYMSYKIWKSKDYWAKLIGAGETEAAAWINALNNIENEQRTSI